MAVHSTSLLRGSLPPLRGEDRMGGENSPPAIASPPILTFPRDGGSDPPSEARTEPAAERRTRWQLALPALGCTWRTVRYLTAAQIAARARFMALRQVYGLAPRWPIARARRAAAGTVAAPALPKLPAALLC